MPRTRQTITIRGQIAVVHHTSPMGAIRIDPRHHTFSTNPLLADYIQFRKPVGQVVDTFQFTPQVPTFPAGGRRNLSLLSLRRTSHYTEASLVDAFTITYVLGNTVFCYCGLVTRMRQLKICYGCNYRSSLVSLRPSCTEFSCLKLEDVMSESMS